MLKKILGVIIGIPILFAFVLVVIYSQAKTLEWQGRMIGSNFKVSGYDSSLPVSERGVVSFVEATPYDRFRPYKCRVLIQAPRYSFGLDADALESDLKKGRNVDKAVLRMIAKSKEKRRDIEVVETFNKIIESPDFYRMLGDEESKFIPSSWLDVLRSSSAPLNIKNCFSQAVNQLILEKYYVSVVPEPFIFGEKQLIHEEEAWVSKNDVNLISEFELLPVQATYLIGNYKNPVWVIWKIKPLKDLYTSKMMFDSIRGTFSTLEQLKELEERHHTK